MMYAYGARPQSYLRQGKPASRIKINVRRGLRGRKVECSDTLKNSCRIELSASRRILGQPNCSLRISVCEEMKRTIRKRREEHYIGRGSMEPGSLISVPPRTFGVLLGDASVRESKDMWEEIPFRAAVEMAYGQHAASLVDKNGRLSVSGSLEEVKKSLEQIESEAVSEALKLLERAARKLFSLSIFRKWHSRRSARAQGNANK
jgi:hypothetical protein